MKTIIIAVIAALIIGGHCEHNYTRKDCKVTQYNDGWATVQDKSGNHWDIYADNIEVGQKVNLKMHTNYTPNDCEDDIIKGVVR